jgi:hypothetical protein
LARSLRQSSSRPIRTSTITAIVFGLDKRSEELHTQPKVPRIKLCAEQQTMRMRQTTGWMLGSQGDDVEDESNNRYLVSIVQFRGFSFFHCPLALTPSPLLRQGPGTWPSISFPRPELPR